MPALENLKLKDHHKFKVNLNYIIRPCFKKKKDTGLAWKRQVTGE